MKGSLLNGRYLLTHQFHEGSLGSVFKASDINLKREVSVKLLHLEVDELEQFKSQASQAAQLNHTNVTAFYDWGIDNSPYIVTELCRGESLEKLIKSVREESNQGKNIVGAIFKGGLSISQIISIGSQIADGLAHVHSKGFIYQNIKPSSILFDLEGRAKLSSFEIIKMFREKTSPEIANRLLGSSFYSSPEEMESEGVQKSDIFSLGLLLLELALGVPPFDEESKLGAFLDRLNESLEIPKELEELGDVLGLALKQDPDQRPSATEFAWHLNGIKKKYNEAVAIPIQPSEEMLRVTKVNWKKYLPKEALDDSSLSTKDTVKKDTAKTLQALQTQVKEKLQINTEDFLQPQRVVVSTNFKISKFGLMFAIISLIAISSITTISIFNRVNQPGVVVQEIPDVVGLSKAEAVDILDDNWEVRELSLRIQGVAEGKVAQTDPSAGQKLEKGGVVYVTSSKGDPLVSIPASLLGVSLEVAELRLKGIGLNLGQIKRRDGIRLIAVSRQQANFAQDIIVGFDEPIGMVPWGSAISVIVFRP